MTCGEQTQAAGRATISAQPGAGGAGRSGPVSIDQRNKELVWDFWHALNGTTPHEVKSVLERAMHPAVSWNGPCPIDGLTGLDAVVDGFWAPLMTSFEGLERRCDVFLGDESCGEHWVSACGYFTGRFVHDWLGIPATGEPAYVHFGEHCLIEDGRITEVYLILDVPSVMRQAGFQVLPPSRGAEGGRFLPPPRGEGVQLTEQDEVESRRTRQLVAALIRSIESRLPVPDEDFWHPDMHWYGPTGIGSCFGLAQYEQFHGAPWVQAFPDVLPTPPGGRLIGIADGEILAEGHYAALGVWDQPFSVHRGTYLGVPATDKLITMRDFDWYRREGNRLVQNWVPIDLLDILRQFGVDPMDRLARWRAGRE